MYLFQPADLLLSIILLLTVAETAQQFLDALNEDVKMLVPPLATNALTDMFYETINVSLYPLAIPQHFMMRVTMFAVNVPKSKTVPAYLARLSLIRFVAFAVMVMF